MADNAKAMEWAGYLSPNCGKYKFAKRQYGVHYPCVKSKREEYARKGGLPDACIKSWKACDRHLQDTDTKCREEKKTLVIDTAQYLDRGTAMPLPVPTVDKAGWVYPASWQLFLAPPGSTPRPGAGGGDEPRIDPDIVNVPTTSTSTVAIGLGVGVVLLVAGIWLFNSKSKPKS